LGAAECGGRGDIQRQQRAGAPDKDEDRLALQLLMHLAQLTGHSPGTDVVVVHALQDTFAGTGSGAAGGTVGEADIVDCGTRLQSLKKVVDKAVGEQWVHPGPTALSSSLESVDQVLVPVVFAGSVVLTTANARRVADAIAAGDSITASKYHSLYALHDATRMVASVPVTLPPGFQVTHLEQRIRPSSSSADMAGICSRRGAWSSLSMPSPDTSRSRKLPSCRVARSLAHAKGPSLSLTAHNTGMKPQRAARMATVQT
jgi:hypothetical protein